MSHYALESFGSGPWSGNVSCARQSHGWGRAGGETRSLTAARPPRLGHAEPPRRVAPAPGHGLRPERALSARQPEPLARANGTARPALIEDDLRASIRLHGCLDSLSETRSRTSKSTGAGQRRPSAIKRVRCRKRLIGGRRGVRAGIAALGECRRARAAVDNAKSWSGISPKAHRSSALDLRDRALNGEPLPSGRRWPDWPAPVQCAATGSIGVVTATPARRARSRRQTLRAEAARLAQERDEQGRSPQVVGAIPSRTQALGERRHRPTRSPLTRQCHVIPRNRGNHKACAWAVRLPRCTSSELRAHAATPAGAMRRIATATTQSPSSRWRPIGPGPGNEKAIT